MLALQAVVREVLHDEQIERQIGQLVGGCLANDKVANGIVDAIKGTSINVLSDASDLVKERLPLRVRQALSPYTHAARAARGTVARGLSPRRALRAAQQAATE